MASRALARLRQWKSPDSLAFAEGLVCSQIRGGVEPCSWIGRGCVRWLATGQRSPRGPLGPRRKIATDQDVEGEQKVFDNAEAILSW